MTTEYACPGTCDGGGGGSGSGVGGGGGGGGGGGDGKSHHSSGIKIRLVVGIILSVYVYSDYKSVVSYCCSLISYCRVVENTVVTIISVNTLDLLFWLLSTLWVA